MAEDLFKKVGFERLDNIDDILKKATSTADIPLDKDGNIILDEEIPYSTEVSTKEVSSQDKDLEDFITDFFKGRD